MLQEATNQFKVTLQSDGHIRATLVLAQFINCHEMFPTHQLTRQIFTPQKVTELLHLSQARRQIAIKDCNNSRRAKMKLATRLELPPSVKNSAAMQHFYHEDQTTRLTSTATTMAEMNLQKTLCDQTF